MAHPPDETDSPVRFELRPLGVEGANTAIVWLNRPATLNAIDRATLDALDEAITAVDDDPSVRAVLITGTGQAFSAGGDLKQYLTLQRDPVAFPKFVTDLHATFGRLGDLRVPVIALINGVTAAGGLELVLNCDFAVIARSARIGDAHLNFGQMGGGGVLTLLPRAIGRARASELILSGRLLDAAEAVDWGLAARWVDDDELLATGVDLAARIAEKSPLAVANAKHVLHSLWANNGSVEAGLRVERETNNTYCLTSHDAREGLEAFREKRRPRFEGR
jgi:enoyl-CoA hydratase/carnithine racemase